jgi:hypothetical protein
MTRQAIQDAAQAMFAERGYDNVTVAEIADAVNIVHLARLPDLQEWLAADPLLIPGAIGELLRYESIVHMSRTVTEGCTRPPDEPGVS